MKIKIAGFFVLSLLFLLVLSACDDIGAPQFPTKERVTFALVLNTRLHNGEKVIAYLKENIEEGARETIAGFLESVPNTTNQSWVKMTTLEKMWTNQGYFLDFFIDLDGDEAKSTGDLSGVQFFDVRSNAVWSEAKYFFEDLFEEP
jgi:hypothetical protein